MLIDTLAHRIGQATFMQLKQDCSHQRKALKSPIAF